MAPRSHSRKPSAELAFDAISIEGGLLAADWLTRVAQRQAPQQSPTDYGIPKGLELRDEISRYWRMAQAQWADFEAKRKHNAAPDALAQSFVLDLLRSVFGFHDLVGVAAGRRRPEEDAATSAPPGLEVNGRTWPLCAIDDAHRVPLVCAPAAAGLDTPQPHLGDGQRKRSAFGLVQDFLNATDAALWGLCSDGLTLRLVRDNASLTRPAWVEIDLARLFTEDRYPDFAAAWLLLHRSRFGRAGQAPESCALETWRNAAREEGTRARDRLREGFKEALALLGQGFLTHPANQPLREALYRGDLTQADFFGQLLRLVYRLIFLLSAEERELLHAPGLAAAIRDRYALGYGLRRLRDRSTRRRAYDTHADLWSGLRIVFAALEHGEPALGLPALGGLFAARQCSHLDAASLDNRSLLAAVFRLSWLQESTGIARVNWRDMGPEELGSVYESLLELEPVISLEARHFCFNEGVAGNARKTTGSYYTPDSLVQVLLDSALEPVVARTLAAAPEDPAAALLSLTIVDPACGSGHFLLAAARRLAGHLARVEAQGSPSAADYRKALRRVVGRCIYGVDLNPMAVELCKVALWMEAVEPGRPLGFLDAHIRWGNALIGATPEMMARGIPDEAWAPLEGDDKRVASALKRRNKKEAGGQRTMVSMWSTESDDEAEQLKTALAALEAAPDTDAAALAQKEAQWAEVLASAAWRRQKLVADAWCAAFMWPKPADDGPVVAAAPTAAVWSNLRDGRGAPPPLLVETAAAIAAQHRFFHWHLAFATVFEKGGFDVVLGNPPWERVKLQEQEFFASRDPAIANAANAAARKKRIAQLPETDPVLWAAWSAASREAQGQSHFVRSAGRYPLCGKGDVNTYALFAEHNRTIANPEGRAGFIVPTGIATDDTTKDYFGSLLANQHLARFLSFENEAFIFPGVHHAFRFALLVVDKSGQCSSADLLFFARHVSNVADPSRHFSLSAAEFATLNPNTRTCPTFRTRRDADLNLALYRRAGVLWREGPPEDNPWQLRFMRLLDMANDSGLFQDRAHLERAGYRLEGHRFVRDHAVMLPLFEAKMVHQFDHRFGDYADRAPGSKDTQLAEVPLERLQNPHYAPQPRYWVDRGEVDAKLAGRWERGWLLGWRDITNAQNQRTVIAAVIPRVAVGHTTPLMFSDRAPSIVAALYANLCSFALDYAARQKVGGTHLTYSFLKQLPVLAPATYAAPCPWQPGTSWQGWILPRVLELTYTAWDLAPFARDCGHDGPPFRWDPERRALLRAELDAAFFHLYGVSRDDADYILDTFPIIRRKEEAAFGEYRTKRLILALYDALAAASASGQAYISPLSPPPRTP